MTGLRSTNWVMRRNLAVGIMALAGVWRGATGWAQNGTVEMPLPAGAVGIGTYATVAQFKDLRVSVGGQMVLENDLKGVEGFQLGGGQWKIVDGYLQQSSTEAKGDNTFTGDKSWTDYTASVKARKVTGKEGFSLSVRAQDEKNFVCLNVGGWNNTKVRLGCGKRIIGNLGMRSRNARKKG